MAHTDPQDEEFSFKSLFVPLTAFKAISWIIIIGFIVFANALFNGFVWDDKTYIVQNPEIHTFNFISLFKQNYFNQIGQYRPIPALYFTILHGMFGETTFFYHFLQIGIHIVNSSLAFLFLCRFFHKKLSLFLSFVFLVHPIQVESVSYIAATGNPLFFLFGMTALWVSTKEEISRKRLTAIFCLLLLSILTKETGFLFFIIILFYRFLFQRKNILKFLISSAITTGIYLFIRLSLYGIYFAKLSYIPIATLSFDKRIINIPAILFYYVKTFFYPIELSINQQWTVINVTYADFYLPLIMSLLFFIALGMMGVYLFKQKKQFHIFLFFSLWFIAGLFMHLNIFPLDGTVADRWFYFPFVGLIGILGVGIQIIQKRFSSAKAAWTVIAILVICFLFVRTSVRNADWSDAFTLYSHDIRYGKSAFLENDLGIEYMLQNENDNAAIHFKKSIDMLPFEVNLFNLGLVYSKENDKNDARIYFKKSVDNYKGYADYVVVARLLFLYDDPEDAKTLIQKGLVARPDDMNLLMYLALAEYKLGDKQNALATAQKTYSLYPNANTQYMLNQIRNNLSLQLK